MKINIKRILADIVDFYIICFVASALVLIFTLGKMNITPLSVSLYITVAIVLLTFKDFVFKNASVGKRMFRIMVVKENGTDLTFTDYLKRTIPLIIWPIEFILILVSNRRLGDIWAKTSVSEFALITT